MPQFSVKNYNSPCRRRENNYFREGFSLKEIYAINPT